MKTSKSAIFLFELMIIILVFTIAAAICTSIFAAAYNMSRESEDLTMSAIKAQTVAEIYKSDDADVSASEYYDSDWEKTDEKKAVYSVSIEGKKSENGLRHANVVVYRIDGAKQKSIFSIPVSRYEGK